MGDVTKTENIQKTDNQNQNGGNAGHQRADGAEPVPRELTPAEMAKQTAENLLDFTRSVVQGIGDAARQYKEAQAKIKELPDADKAKFARYVALLGAGSEFHQDSPERKDFAKELRELGVQDQYNSFHIRESAQAAIRKMGPGACPLLEKELQNADPEIRMRVSNLYGSNINGGGLISIDREPQKMGAGGAAGVLGRLVLGGVGGAFGGGGLDFDTKRDIQFKVEQTSKFADDPVKTAKRIEQVDQILAQSVLGKIHLSPERVKDLQTELKNLKQIGPLCAALHMDLAHECSFDRDIAGAKAALEGAMKRDKNLIKSDDVMRVILKCGLDKTDPAFMESYVKMGGDEKKVAKMRADRDAEEKRWKEQMDNTPNQGGGMMNPPARPAPVAPPAGGIFN